MGRAYHATAVPGLGQRRVLACMRSWGSVIITWPTADCFWRLCAVITSTSEMKLCTSSEKPNILFFCLFFCITTTIVTFSFKLSVQTEGNRVILLYMYDHWNVKCKQHLSTPPQYVNNNNDFKVCPCYFSLDYNSNALHCVVCHCYSSTE